VVAVLDLIPGIDAVWGLLATAGAVIYNNIQGGTVSHYEDALADTTLWSDMQCAIYTAISPDGFVTAGNFADIISNVTAVTYTHAEVISTIVDYLNAMGADGLMGAQQTGSLYVGDCSSCAPPSTWCYEFDFTASDGGWTAVDNVAYPCHWSTGVGWVSDGAGTIGLEAVYIQRAFTSEAITSIEMAYHFAHASDAFHPPHVFYNFSSISSPGAVYGYYPNTAGDQDATVTATVTTGGLAAAVESYPTASGTNIVTLIRLHGAGTNPFGTDNCI
jgi:hypothetical protein